MNAVAVMTVGAWMTASGAYALKPRKPLFGDILSLIGVVSGILFLGWLWATLERPPIRTLGETRWWYAVLVPALGLLIGFRFNTRALAIPSCLMGALFVGINVAHPENMDKTLMPALQSPWFVPHVVVYMVAYAALGLSGLLAAWALVRAAWKKEPIRVEDADVPHRMVQVGLPLLTCGLLFGAFWAKEAWGHYWTWDPKETWAFLTWNAYLAYLHVRTRHVLKPKLNLWLLLVGFAALMLCWFGVNAMPTAQESVHTYTQN
jgi:ABC-type transport system involved in cytochrome c biogenesis permease subunit